MKMFSLGLALLFAGAQADGCDDKVGKACRDDPLCNWNSKFKICSSSADVCSEPGPTGSMVRRCQKCLSLEKFTEAGCVFDGDDLSCKRSGDATSPISDPANCPSPGANKKTTPPPAPTICDGDGCCQFGKAKGVAIDQNPPNKLYKASADDEFQCALACATFSCEYWSFDTKDETCQLWGNGRTKMAGPPTKPAQRFISGAKTCRPTPQ